MHNREIRASIGQRLMWLKNVSEGQSGALNCPLVCRIAGPLDVNVLRRSLHLLSTRHESLRTTLARRGRTLRQIIHPPEPIELSASDGAASINALVKEELSTPIDCAQWPVRCRLWQTAPEDYLLVLNMHHLITDSYSCMVLHEELALAYEQCKTGEDHLPPSGWQFSQFMAWQQRQLDGGGFRRQREYWRAQLEGSGPLRLPLYPMARRGARVRANLRGRMDANTGKRLTELAQRHRTTLFVAALSAYCVLLRDLTQQEDLAVTSLFANRLQPQVANTVGFLANLAILRTDLRGAANFVSVLERVRKTFSLAAANQELPYHVAIPGIPGQDNIRADDAIFQMLTDRVDPVHGTSLEFRGVVPELEGRFDWEVALMPMNETIGVNLCYAKDRMDFAWAARFLAAYLMVTAAVAEQPEGALQEILNACLR